ncbi:MAG: MarC family protein [Desulfovibrio sp.]|jgi:multiple antibiotic resistance protein|nr:MarC family protein [Desulfovibrio sp.]
MDTTHLGLFLSGSLKLFALMTPPVALTAFLSVSRHYDAERKKLTARKTALAIFIMGSVLYFSGDAIFAFFGFTLDAFRIGAGSLLFLSAVSLMNERPEKPFLSPEDDISIVPLAIPLCLGPASIGTLIIIGASAKNTVESIIGALALLSASFGIYLILHFADGIQNRLGKVGMAVLAKLTGLLLAAIAAQVTFTGVHAFLR